MLAASEPPQPAAQPGAGLPERGELFPYLAWTQVHPLTALDGPLSPPLSPAPAPAGSQRVSPVLLKLREAAGAAMGFIPRPLASPEEEAAFESAEGAHWRSARSSPDPADALALAKKLLGKVDAGEADDGLRRLFLVRALALASHAPRAAGTAEGEEDLAEVIASRLPSSLHPEVPADLTA